MRRTLLPAELDQEPIGEGPFVSHLDARHTSQIRLAEQDRQDFRNDHAIEALAEAAMLAVAKVQVRFFGSVEPESVRLGENSGVEHCSEGRGAYRHPFANFSFFGAAPSD